MYRQVKQVFMKKASMFLLAIVTVMFGIFLLPSPIHAQGTSTALVCSGLHLATWTPGVTSDPNTIQVGAQSTWTCSNVSGGPVVLNGASSDSFLATFSCGSIFSPVTATWVINWTDANAKPVGQSQYQFTARVTAVQNDLVIAAPGSITSGMYSGASATGSFTLNNLAALVQNGCNVPGGVTNASGPSTLTLTGP
ncbi:conserved exported protein of unknown function (plasmid) [Ralstonia solanacearum CMR15]|nr:conserved exported protein of unknown function [Ralstonia solanacearum CMR15]